jgi:two-component system chemotaxis response regulator CheY
VKILIVDDNAITRDLMKTLLPPMGHQVVGEAEDGNQAIKLFSELRPDLVLLDLIMPGKTGLEVLDKIQAIDPSAKVIMVTAVQQDGITQALIDKGAIAVLSKPFSCKELSEVMEGFE